MRDDIAVAYEQVAHKFGIKNEVKHLAEHLEDDEQVVAMSSGMIANSGNGALVLTDRRVVFLFHGMVRKGVEEFRLDQVTSVASKTGPMWASLTLTVAGATKSIGQVHKKDVDRIVKAIRSAIGSAAPAAGAGGGDVVAQLGRLKELCEAGVLTEEEFAAKKAEMLARL